MTPSGVVSLLTDFGLVDPFVGLMHAVISRRFPEARIVDLCHGVEPQDVREGAFFVERCYRWFAPGTVHVAVVDPGVGTDRAPLAMEADGHLFVAPDNGLLGQIAARSDAVAHRIDLERLGIVEPSRTFHGRDVFAPAAAELARGSLAVSDLGPRITPRRLPDPPSGAKPDGHVVSVDRFGNLITDVDATALGRFERPLVVISGRELPLSGTYGEVPVGELTALVSSFGTVEIAVREGSARALLGLERGAPVALREAG